MTNTEHDWNWEARATPIVWERGEEREHSEAIIELKKGHPHEKHKRLIKGIPEEVEEGRRGRTSVDEAPFAWEIPAALN